MAAKQKMLHLPSELVERAKESLPRLRQNPTLAELSPTETGTGAVRSLVWLALENLDRLLPPT